MSLMVLLILALAAARLTALLVFDDIAEPLRHRIFRWSPPAQEHELSDIYAGGPGFFGRVISCHHCTGIWVAAGIAAAYGIAPPPTLDVAGVFALAQLSDIAIKVAR